MAKAQNYWLCKFSDLLNLTILPEVISTNSHQCHKFILDRNFKKIQCHISIVSPAIDVKGMQNFITSFPDFIPQNQRQNYKRRKKEIKLTSIQVTLIKIIKQNLKIDQNQKILKLAQQADHCLWICDKFPFSQEIRTKIYGTSPIYLVAQSNFGFLNTQIDNGTFQTKFLFALRCCVKSNFYCRLITNVHCCYRGQIKTFEELQDL